MKRITRKFLSFLLTLAMVLSLVPTLAMVLPLAPAMVFAAEPAGETILTADYSSLQEAVNAAENGDTVKLSADIAGKATVATSGSITIDLNSHTITGTITVEGDLTVKDSGEGGTIYKKETGDFWCQTIILAGTEATFTLESGSLQVEASSAGGHAVAIQSNATNGTIYIKGGVISASAATAENAFAVLDSWGSGANTYSTAVNITGGTFTGKLQLQNTDAGDLFTYTGHDPATISTVLNAIGKTEITLDGTADFNDGGITISAGKSIFINSACKITVGAITNSGTIEVDMTGAAEESIKLIDCTGTAASYGSSGTNYKFAEGKDNGYELIVEDKDLFAKKSATFDDCFGGEVTKDNYKTWTHGDYTLEGWYYDNGGTPEKLVGDAQCCVAYTARWTKNGKAVITEPIDLSAPSGDVAGDGWSWDNDNRVLTMTDTILDVEGSDAYSALMLPADSGIVLNGTSNIILKNTAAEATETSTAVKCAGALNISGTGVLNITAESADEEVRGIETGTSLVIENGSVNASVSGTDYAIYAKTGLTLEGTGKITADGKIGSENYIGDKGDHFYTVTGAYQEGNGTSRIFTQRPGEEEEDPPATIEISLQKYTACFDGVTGTQASQETTGYVTRPTDKPSRTGYTFAGWTSYADDGIAYVFNFEQSYIRRDTTFSAVWIDDSKAVSDCTGSLKDHNGNPVSGAWVAVNGAGGTYGNTETDSNGTFTFKDLPDGIYNIQMISSSGTGNMLVSTYTAPADSGKEYRFFENENFVILMKAGDTADDVVIDGLEQLGIDESETGKTVMLGVSVNEWSVDEDEEAAIEKIAGGRSLTSFDVEISKTVDNDASLDITETDNVLTLIVPYDTSRSGIMVYRYHNAAAESFIKEAVPMEIPADRHFYVDTANKLIYIYTSQFSTYAIGYTSSTGSGARNYLVTVADADRGSVTASTGKTHAGNTVTVTITPDKGYTLETITVTDQNGREIALTPVTYGEEYTFKMPAGAVTVAATFMEDNTMLNYFVDVNARDYCYDAVLWAAENGVTSGIDALHFAPDAAATRAQMITFLWKLAGCPESGLTCSPFADVKADAYYYKAVLWAVEKGIAEGTSATAFSPDAKVSRCQAVTFLWKYSGKPAAEAESRFTDVETDAYYYAAVLWANAKEITEGTGETVFSPDADCTRGQIVTFLFKSILK